MDERCSALAPVLEQMTPPPRVPWREFPNAVLLAAEPRTKQHPHYSAAKSGNVEAAAMLVSTLVNEAGIDAVRNLIAAGSFPAPPMLVSVHSYESEGFNAIPAAGADGYGRLARQAAFAGKVGQGCRCVMVDDFIGQGGTLANLRGWIENQGGSVVGAVGLTGKPYSAKLRPSKEQLDELRRKHGAEFEGWWQERFGHAFDCLTQSEARYLARSADVDSIRNRLAAAVRQGSV